MPLGFPCPCKAVQIPESMGSWGSLFCYLLRDLRILVPLPGEVYYLVYEFYTRCCGIFFNVCFAFCLFRSEFLKFVHQVWEVTFDFAEVQCWFETRLVFFFLPVFDCLGGFLSIFWFCDVSLCTGWLGLVGQLYVFSLTPLWVCLLLLTIPTGQLRLGVS